MEKNLWEELEASPYVKTSGKDPIDNFKSLVADQIKKVENAIKLEKAGTDPKEIAAKFNPRSDWVIPKSNYYVVRFSRFQIPSPNGTKAFKAPDLTTAKKFLEVGQELVNTDKEFQGKIAAASEALKATLAKNRGSGNTKKK